MSSIRKHFSLEAANLSLFSQEGEVTSPLISGPAWTLRLQFTEYQQRCAPVNFFLLFIFLFFYFFCNSTLFIPEHWIIQEPVYVLHLITCLSWMRRPTGDQEVAGSTPAEVGSILLWRLIMKYFLWSFSPFCWFKKGSCQFLAKECAQYWLTA